MHAFVARPLRLTLALSVGLAGSSCQAPAPRGTCLSLQTRTYCAQITVGQPVQIGQDVPITLVVWANATIDPAVATIVAYGADGLTLAEPATWTLALQGGVAVTETTTLRIEQTGWYTVLGQLGPAQDRPAIDEVTLHVTDTGGTVYPANAPLPTP